MRILRLKDLLVYNSIYHVLNAFSGAFRLASLPDWDTSWIKHSDQFDKLMAIWCFTAAPAYDGWAALTKYWDRVRGDAATHHAPPLPQGPLYQMRKCVPRVGEKITHAERFALCWHVI